jgi:E3 ubiquitin-protein ligase HERC2
MGAGVLLRKYVKLLCSHVSDIIPIAASLATTSSHEYLIQHSLKSAGTKDNFRGVKVPGTAIY